MKNDEQGTKIITGLIITAFLLGFGIFNWYYNYKVSKAPHVISILFGFVPAIVSIIKFIKLYNDTIGNYVFLSISLIVLSALFIICSLVSTKVLNKVTDVTDVNAYEKVLKYDEYSSNKSIAHFPESIPNAASDKEFKEWGNSGSDSQGMILSYNLKDKLKSDELESKLDNAIYKAISKAGIDEVSDKIYVPDLVYDKLGLKNQDVMSDDFEYYVLDASNKDENSKNNYSYGVIVDNTNNKLTYYSIKSK